MCVLTQCQLESEDSATCLLNVWQSDSDVPVSAVHSQIAFRQGALGFRLLACRSLLLAILRCLACSVTMLMCLRKCLLVSSSQVVLCQRSLTFRLLACRPSSSIALRTALPPAEHTGFPPKVLKCSRCDMVLAISSVVTTAASGSPLPIPFAIVTISGITPWFSNPQNLVPVRPNPV